MFWLGLLVGILAYVIIIGILTFYNYHKQKRLHQSYKLNDKNE